MKHQFFRFSAVRLLLVFSLFLATGIATAQRVDIPDANLRAAIAETLGKTSGDTITVAEMATLTGLEAGEASISDLTGLEHATNLTSLYLWNNSIVDISALRGLTNLTELYLGVNSISDLSALRGLTNLTHLHLYVNSIVDISALRGLTNLTELRLVDNSIVDISALRGLTNLTSLWLGNNSISDLSALRGLTNLTFLDLNNTSITDLSPLVANTGLGSGDTVHVTRSPLLSAVSINTHIPALQQRGVTVYFNDFICITNRQPENFVGRVMTPSPYRPSPQPVSGAVVTIMSGTHRGTSVMTDQNGQYTFKNVSDDELHLLVEKADFEPKAVIVHRERGTILANGDVPNHPGDPQKCPSTILIGHRWPDEVRFILEEVLLPYDLLYADGGTPPEDYPIYGVYARGVAIAFEDFIRKGDSEQTREAAIVRTVAHEIAHAYQYARVSVDGSGDGFDWLNTPEGQAFIAARERDQEEGNVTRYDTIHHYTFHFENSAETIATYWGIGRWDHGLLEKDLKRNAPHRYKWAAEWVYVNPPARGEPVNIPDPNLRAMISQLLGDTITASDLVKWSRLESRDANISDLTGLEHATNLTHLSLTGNRVSDLSPLAGLTQLEDLALWDNNITDISAVAGLTHLTGLHLGGNNISDISPVAGLTRLTALHLPGNNISDVSVVSGLTGLTYLNLNGTNIADISSLSGLTHLTELYLGWNNISDLSPLVANTGLGSGDEINVRQNPLSYQSLYTHIPALQQRGVEVEFDNRRVQRLTKISGDTQQGTVGEELRDLFIVEVRDRNGAVFAEVPVTFAVTEGGGTLSVTRTTTDNNGRAESRLTLGARRGTHTVRVSAADAADLVVFNAVAKPITTQYRLSIPAGISLIHIPLKVTQVDGVATSIESISDLYAALGDADAVNFLMTYDSEAGDFLGYFGPTDTGGSSDKALTDDMGIIAGLTAPVSVQLTGNPLGIGGTSTITLTPGPNLVGLPLNDLRLTRVSDLFALNGIGGNVPVIILADGGEFKSVGRAGDPGDIPITGGQGFIMTALQPAQVIISGEGWTNGSGTAAAPLVAKVTDTTPVLALRGAVVDERTGLKGDGFRVTAKNLSTGRTIAGMAKDAEAGYRLTVVDIEKGRAAAIGDTLEISAQSPDPLIGVQPLRYTVTAEDVEQSLIQLPELVAYEIPAETALLTNYPNPFNPETWIPYRLAEDSFVKLTIYDTAGRVVRSVDVGHRVAAVYEDRSKAIYFDGRNQFGETVTSGVYFYHLQAGDYSATRKMLIAK